MKRFLIAAIAIVAISSAALAQDMYYAKMLSQNNYYGTARSLALGNAMTALGGDLGSVTINPAGSAVASYGQFTITPGLVISSSGAAYSPDGTENFGSPFKKNHTKFNLPNLGLMMVFYDYDAEFIKSMSMGFVANTSNSFLNYTTGRGLNSSTSFLGSLAAGAWGVSPGDMPRDLYSAYVANQIGEYGPVGSNVYAGANERLNSDETYQYIPGALNQNATYNSYGSKSDMVFNLGFNVLDAFYFGFNLGIPSLKYSRQELFAEAAQEPGQFPVIFSYEDSAGNPVKETTNYVSSSNGYILNTNATGIYAQFGFIALPTEHLRIGASIQTPTLYNISERWYYTAATSYEDSYFDGYGESSTGEASYALRTPYVVDAGIAYTLPGVGLFSVDYELADFSVMKYRDLDIDYYFYDDSNSWAATNLVNNTFCGVSHSVRAGIEVKPQPFLALRAGYSFITDPEKYYLDEKGRRVTAETVEFMGNTAAFKQQLGDFRYFNNATHAVSLGAGYSSPGSFFADLALRLTSYPVSYYSPYYYGSYDALDKNGNSINVGAPLERIDRNVFDVIMTLGWRF